jgi:hypothetical protein
MLRYYVVTNVDSFIVFNIDNGYLLNRYIKSRLFLLKMIMITVLGMGKCDKAVIYLC